MNTTPRPIHLNVTRIKFPVMAIVSIMHRLSGILLFLLLPFVLYLLQASLYSQDSFVQLQQFLAEGTPRFLMWLLICAVSFHFLAGMRHMLLDCGWGESVKAARVSAILIITCIVVIMIFTGAWLWPL